MANRKPQAVPEEELPPGASAHQVELVNTVQTRHEVYFPGTVHARDEEHAAHLEAQDAAVSAGLHDAPANYEAIRKGVEPEDLAETDASGGEDVEE